MRSAAAWAGRARACDLRAPVAHRRRTRRTRFQAFRAIKRCSSSVVEHSLGKGEVDSSILSSSTSPAHWRQGRSPRYTPPAALDASVLPTLGTASPSRQSLPARDASSRQGKHLGCFHLLERPAGRGAVSAVGALGDDPSAGRGAGMNVEAAQEGRHLPAELISASRAWHILRPGSRFRST